MQLKKGLGSYHYLFPEKPGVNNKTDLYYDDDGITYATYGMTSVLMSNHLVEAMQSFDLDTMVDATGGLGSNTIAFGLDDRIEFVQSYEINPVRFEGLKRNVSVYGLDNKVTLHNMSSIDALNCPWEKAALFVDPPWGGKNYRENKTITDLDMGELSFVEFVDRAIDEYPVIGLKLPTNFARRVLQSLCKDKDCELRKIKVHKNIDFYLIINDKL